MPNMPAPEFNVPDSMARPVDLTVLRFVPPYGDGDFVN